jgi:hypothetical protein
MFKLFRKGGTPPEPPRRPSAPKTAAKPATGRRSLPAPLEPPPVPQVVEGNQESDWDLWESSMMELDSQMQPLDPRETIRDRQGESSRFNEEPDPFSSVRGKNAR